MLFAIRDSATHSRVEEPINVLEKFPDLIQRREMQPGLVYATIVARHPAVSISSTADGCVVFSATYKGKIRPVAVCYMPVVSELMVVYMLPDTFDPMSPRGRRVYKLPTPLAAKMPGTKLQSDLLSNVAFSLTISDDKTVVLMDLVDRDTKKHWLLWLQEFEINEIIGELQKLRSEMQRGNCGESHPR
jgi:hypothetical protein